MGRSRRTPNQTPAGAPTAELPTVHIDVGDAVGMPVQVLQRLTGGWLLRLDRDDERRLNLLGTVKLHVRAPGRQQMLDAKARVVRVINREVAQSRGMQAGVHIELLRHDPVVDAQLARALERPQEAAPQQAKTAARSSSTTAKTPSAALAEQRRSPTPAPARSTQRRSPTPAGPRTADRRSPTPAGPRAADGRSPTPTARRTADRRSPTPAGTPRARTQDSKRGDEHGAKRKPDPLAVEASATAVKLRGELRRLSNMAAADRLGIERDSSTREIRRGFVQAARRFHPDSYHRYGRQDIVQLAEEIYLLLSEAEQRLLQRRPSSAPRNTPAPSTKSGSRRRPRRRGRR